MDAPAATLQVLCSRMFGVGSTARTFHTPLTTLTSFQPCQSHQDSGPRWRLSNREIMVAISQVGSLDPRPTPKECSRKTCQPAISHRERTYLAGCSTLVPSSHLLPVQPQRQGSPAPSDRTWQPDYPVGPNFDTGEFWLTGDATRAIQTSDMILSYADKHPLHLLNNVLQRHQARLWRPGPEAVAILLVRNQQR